MELQEKETTLTALEKEIKKQAQWFLKASETVRNEGVSNYPIIVAHQQPGLQIGLELFQEEETITTNWSYRITTLEELVAKKIVALENIDSFRNLYRSKPQHYCVFLVDMLKSEFIFFPHS